MAEHYLRNGQANGNHLMKHAGLERRGLGPPDERRRQASRAEDDEGPPSLQAEWFRNPGALARAMADADGYTTLQVRAQPLASPLISGESILSSLSNHAPFQWGSLEVVALSQLELALKACLNRVQTCPYLCRLPSCPRGLQDVPVLVCWRVLGLRADGAPAQSKLITWVHWGCVAWRRCSATCAGRAASRTRCRSRRRR